MSNAVSTRSSSLYDCYLHDGITSTTTVDTSHEHSGQNEEEEEEDEFIREMNMTEEEVDKV